MARHKPREQRQGHRGIIILLSGRFLSSINNQIYVGLALKEICLLFPSLPWLLGNPGGNENEIWKSLRVLYIMYPNLYGLQLNIFYQ
jgi:hypothetical protein